MPAIHRCTRPPVGCVEVRYQTDGRCAVVHVGASLPCWQGPQKVSIQASSTWKSDTVFVDACVY
jgi:hypothetical protein